VTGLPPVLSSCHPFYNGIDPAIVRRGDRAARRTQQLGGNPVIGIGDQDIIMFGFTDVTRVLALYNRGML
jgi:hypothetical protein